MESTRYNFITFFKVSVEEISDILLAEDSDPDIIECSLYFRILFEYFTRFYHSDEIIFIVILNI